MAKRIPQAFIQELLNRTDIVELIQARLALKKAGQNYQACCPFHEEKTPSFSVSPSKQFYYCFGCGAHGHAIGFLMNYDRMEFTDAVAQLASKLGLDIPDSHHSQQAPNHSQSYELLTQANALYRQQLKQSPAAINYLKSRGLQGITAKQFELGFAPDQWDFLLTQLGQDATTKKLLIENGLVLSKEQKRDYDRFRQRIMFPIHDERGRTIGFGARSLDGSQPKYINSPETPLFHKSEALYGLYQTLQQHRQVKRFIVVEGYLDVISLHQQHINYAVATLGTASNPKHLQILLRYSNEIIFCFDGDSAGQQAAWKALTMSLPLLRDGIHIRFMFMPPNEDPDSLINRVGQRGFQQRIDQAQPLNTVFFAELKKSIPLDNPANKADFAKRASQYLSRMPSGLYRSLLFQELADLLKVYTSELQQLSAQHTKPTQPATTQPRPDNLVTKAIRLLLVQPQLCHEVTDTQAVADYPFKGSKLLAQLLTLCQEKPTLQIGQLLALWPDTGEKQLIAELAAQEQLPLPTEALLVEFRDCMKKLTSQTHERRYQEIYQKFQQQGQISDEERDLLNELLIKTQRDPI